MKKIFTENVLLTIIIKNKNKSHIAIKDIFLNQVIVHNYKCHLKIYLTYFSNIAFRYMKHTTGITYDQILNLKSQSTKN